MSCSASVTTSQRLQPVGWSWNPKTKSLPLPALKHLSPRAGQAWWRCGRCYAAQLSHRPCWPLLCANSGSQGDGMPSSPLGCCYCGLGLPVLSSVKDWGRRYSSLRRPRCWFQSSVPENIRTVAKLEYVFLFSPPRSGGLRLKARTL